MQDSDLVIESYGDTVKSLFSVFFQNWIVAQAAADPAAAEKDAEDAFVKGIGTARTARDRAMALLPK